MTRLRFLRALALLGSAHALGCGSDDASALASSTHGEDHPASTASGDGICYALDGNTPHPITCGASKTCVFPEEAGVPECVDDAGAVADAEPCGSVTCAVDCWCFYAAKNDCSCLHGPTGPLPPPDLGSA